MEKIGEKKEEEGSEIKKIREMIHLIQTKQKHSIISFFTNFINKIF